MGGKPPTHLGATHMDSNSKENWLTIHPDNACICYIPGISATDVALIAEKAIERHKAGDPKAKDVLLWLLSHREHTKLIWGTYAPASFGLAAERLGADADTLFQHLHLIKKPSNTAKG